MLFTRINNLPDDLKREILKYVSYSATFRLSKVTFDKFFPIYLNIIRFPYVAYYNNIGNPAEKYVKYLLRNDNNYIFRFVLYRFGSAWEIGIRHKMKNKTFWCYLDYLKYLCVEKYKATKCKNELLEFTGNKYKNKRVKYYNSKWTN
jgi:hypothetical protein